MLEGYKPIDFGNLFSTQPDLGQIRNRVGLSQAALNILANSNFKATPVTELLSKGSLPKATGEITPPPRKQTFIGRVIDLLSTPAYAIANAADDAIAGHQSSDTDSVLEDALQIIGGVVTGAGRGIGTGLRGTFADSETAADPMDKIYLGDALIRLDTHMSAKDAMKPENLEKVRKRLEQKKINQLLSDDDPTNKYFYKFDKGKVEVTDKDIEDYFKRMELFGIGASMVGDPINFISAPAKALGLVRGSKGTAETFDAARLDNINEMINKGTPKDIRPSVPDGSYKVVLPQQTFGRVATPEGQLIQTPEWFNFPLSPDAIELTKTTKTVTTPVAKNEIIPFEEIINRPATGIDSPAKLENSILGKRPGGIVPEVKPSADQLKIAQRFSDPDNIVKFSSDILRRIATNSFDNALQRIRTLYPGVKLERTERLITHLRDNFNTADFIKSLNTPKGRKRIAGAFNRVIHADAMDLAKPKKIDTAEEIINKTDHIGKIALVENAKGTGSTLLLGREGQVTGKNIKRDREIVRDIMATFKPQLELTQIPAGIKNAAKYKAAMQKHGTYTGPKQVNVWNALTSKYLKNVKTPQRFEKALNLLKVIEERFIAMGYQPMSSTPKAGDSVVLRLSQVLEAIGPSAAAMNKTLLTKILRGDYSSLPAEVAQKIEALKAGEAIVEGQKFVEGVGAGSKVIDDLTKGPLSAAKTEEVVTIGSKVAEDITKAAGGSPVAGTKAAKYVKETYIPKAPGDGFSVTNTLAIMSHEDVSTKLYKNFSNANKVTQDILRVLGGPPPRELGKKVGPAAKAVEWLGARFNAAYKNADMRPIYLQQAATAKSTVARRAEYLNKLAKRYDVNDSDLWNEALKGAQGRLQPLPGTREAELSGEILQIMENLFGSSGLKQSAVAENTVAGRSQLLMRELNRNLRRFGLGQYQFKKTAEYSEGIKWLNSWEQWDIDKPLEFLFKIQNVVEHTVREKIMFDEIIARFGSPKRFAEFQHTVNHPRLQGFYFGKDAAGQINQFIKMLKEVSTPNSKPMQYFDKVLSKWKAAVTIYIPSHHIRNLIGDVYFNWLAGVNGSRPYSIALNVMRSQHKRYEGLEAISQLTNPDALRKVIEGKGYTAAGKKTALTMRNGEKVTNDMVYVAAFQEGILPTTRILEDIPDDAAMGLDKFRPLGGRGQKFAHTVSEGRDHYVRLAHFVHELKKSNKPFEAAIKDAAAVVRKWHPDGMDLTKFERQVMRRMFPFYSWTRKAFPLILESLLATPGKIMAYPKGQYFLANALGVDTGPISDPFPYDQLFPDWIREKGIAPIGTPDSIISKATLIEDPGYTVVNPGIPSQDLIAQAGNPGTMAMGMLNPAARIPAELAFGRDSQTGAPIASDDPDYWAKQIPGLSHIGRATGSIGVSDTAKENSGIVNLQNIYNMLFAAGYQNTGPYKKSAGFDLREYVRGLRDGR